MGITSYEERLADRLAALESRFEALIAQDRPGSKKFGTSRIPFGGATGVLTDDANLTYNSTTDILALSSELDITGIGFHVKLLRSGQTTRHIGITAADELTFARTGTFDDLRIDANGIALFGNLIRPNNVAVSYGANFVAVANNGVMALGANNFGFAFIHAGGAGAIFAFNGSVHTTNEIVDLSGIYSITAGTANSINVYWSTGNNRYEIENKRGSTLNIRVWFLDAA